MALALVEHQQAIGINQEFLDEWIAYREELKKPLSPRSLKMVIKKLLQWSEAEQERLICHAIENGWRGIYWVEPPKQPGTSTRDSSLEQDLTDTSWAR